MYVTRVSTFLRNLWISAFEFLALDFKFLLLYFWGYLVLFCCFCCCCFFFCFVFVCLFVCFFNYGTLVLYVSLFFPSLRIIVADQCVYIYIAQITPTSLFSIFIKSYLANLVCKAMCWTSLWNTLNKNWMLIFCLPWILFRKGTMQSLFFVCSNVYICMWHSG